MSEETETTVPEVSSDQNYNQAAMEYIEQNNMLDEQPTDDPALEAAEQDATTPEAEETQEAPDSTESEEEEILEASEETEEGEEESELPELDLSIEFNGETLEFESLDELKEYAATGLQLSEEKETLDAELNQTIEQIEQYVGQHQADLDRLKVIDTAFEQIQKSDPALAEEFQQAVAQVAPQLNNPMIQQLQQELAEVKGQFSERANETENKAIVAEWEQGVTEAQKTYGPLLDKLGIKADWDGRVQQAWINSGVDSVESALFAVHGKQIHKLSQSKRTVEKAARKANSASAKPTAGKARSAPGEKKTSTKEMSWRDVEIGLQNGTLNY